MNETLTTSGQGRRTASDGQWLGKSATTATSRLRGAARRRSVPHLLLGVLLLLGCVGGFVMVSVKADDREAVLALARDVRVGQVLSAGDLREVLVAVDAGVAVVAARDAGAVVGRSAAASLPAGSLLFPSAIGRAGNPEAGYGIAALALKPGRFPPGLAAGSTVVLVHAPDQLAAGGASTAGPSWQAVVLDVSSTPGDQASVVTVQLRESAAREVAAVPAGHLAVVVLPNGGR